MKRILATLCTLALAAIAAAPASAGRGITVKGSDTMVILGQRWAEKFMNANAGQVIMVTGGGSGTGIAALINGTTDICQSSRAMKQDEKLKLRDRYQTLGVEIPVAKDGLSVYVHASNGVKQLTMDQVKDMHEPPGGQPVVIRDLMHEAVDYLRRHDLITVPAVAAESFLMSMMSPERQLVNPFFTGGARIAGPEACWSWR